MNSKVISLIEEEVKKLMQELSPHENIRKFIILNKQFTADQGELTRTLKIRRNFVEEKYKEMIDAMYSNQEIVSMKIANDSLEEIILQVVQLTNSQEVPHINDILLPNVN